MPRDVAAFATFAMHSQVPHATAVLYISQAHRAELGAVATLVVRRRKSVTVAKKIRDFSPGATKICDRL
jgi:hypothetical protein